MEQAAVPGGRNYQRGDARWMRGGHAEDAKDTEDAATRERGCRRCRTARDGSAMVPVLSGHY